MCLSLADKGSHGRKVRLDLSLEFPVKKWNNYGKWDMGYGKEKQIKVLHDCSHILSILFFVFID